MPGTVETDVVTLNCLRKYPAGENITNTFLIIKGFAGGHYIPCAPSSIGILVSQIVGTAKQVEFGGFDVYMMPSPYCSISAAKQLDIMGKSQD